MSSKRHSRGSSGPEDESRPGVEYPILAKLRSGLGGVQAPRKGGGVVANELAQALKEANEARLKSQRSPEQQLKEAKELLAGIQKKEAELEVREAKLTAREAEVVAREAELTAREARLAATKAQARVKEAEHKAKEIESNAKTTIDEAWPSRFNSRLSELAPLHSSSRPILRPQSAYSSGPGLELGKRKFGGQSGGELKRVRSQNSVMVSEHEDDGPATRSALMLGGFGSRSRNPLIPKLGEGYTPGSLPQNSVSGRGGGFFPMQNSVVGKPSESLGPDTQDKTPVYRPHIMFWLPGTETTCDENELNSELVNCLWEELSIHLKASPARQKAWENFKATQETCVLTQVISKRNSNFDAQYRCCKGCRSSTRGHPPRPCALFCQLDNGDKPVLLFLPAPGKVRTGGPNDRSFWVAKSRI